MGLKSKLRKILKRKVEPVWMTKEGKRVRVKDMTNDHLNNTIRFLDNKWERNKFIDIPYPDFNGEMAQYAAEGEWERMMDHGTPDLVYPVYKDLQKEKERRIKKGLWFSKENSVADIKRFG